MLYDTNGADQNTTVVIYPFWVSIIPLPTPPNSSGKSWTEVVVTAVTFFLKQLKNSFKCAGKTWTKEQAVKMFLQNEVWYVSEEHFIVLMAYWFMPEFVKVLKIL